MVKENWFKRYDPNELPDRFDLIFQSWDTANKPTELSDYSVCTTWGMKENRFYLLHVLRRRMDYPSLKRAVQEQAQAFGPTVILIEDKASGTQLIQELVEAGGRKRKADVREVVNGILCVPPRSGWFRLACGRGSRVRLPHPQVCRAAPGWKNPAPTARPCGRTSPIRAPWSRHIFVPRLNRAAGLARAVCA